MGGFLMSILSDISNLVQSGKSRDIQAKITEALNSGIPAKEILNDGLCAGMNRIGEKFKNNEIYVPEVLIASRAMTKGTEILKPYLVAEGVEPAGKAVVCTVKGDLHDIGKNLVKLMFEGAGIECIDLGTDADGEKVVNAVRESGAQIVCLSALLTTTMPYQAEIIKALEDAGIRDRVTVMIGGAPVSEDYANKIGADIYTNDAASCAEAALNALKK